MGKPQANLRLVGASEPLQPPRPKVAEAVARLTPYEAVDSRAALAAQRVSGQIYKLDWNEATIAPSPRVAEAIQEYLGSERGLNFYPNLGSPELVSAVSEYTGVEAERILATAGSDDALHLICATFVEAGDRVVVPVPTYNHFVVFAQSRGAQIQEVFSETPFAADPASIRAAMSPDVKLLYLVSPNNPTGVIYPPEFVDEMCTTYPGTLVLLDEAYFEFGKVTGIDLVRRHDNLIVTRTFSKAFGLAGLRVGYLASSRPIIDGLRRIYNPKSVNTFAQIGAIAALSDREWLDAFIGEVDAAKGMLGSFFRDCGFEVHVTPANFIVVRLDDVGVTLDRFVEHGIFVRDRSNYPGLERCVRITVGTVEQTRALVERLRPILR